MGVSENSVPLNLMVNDHYPVFKWLFHWEYTLFSDKPICTFFLYLFYGLCSPHELLRYIYKFNCCPAEQHLVIDASKKGSGFISPLLMIPLEVSRMVEKYPHDIGIF